MGDIVVRFPIVIALVHGPAQERPVPAEEAQFRIAAGEEDLEARGSPPGEEDGGGNTLTTHGAQSTLLAMTKILAIPGSARTESLNRRWLQVTARFAEESGAQVTVIDPREFELPLYDGDLEAAEGEPANAARLKALCAEHDGFLFACPEYNGSITPLLKNIIDWLSRPAGDEPMLAAFRGKTAGLIAASPGGLGGLRGLAHVRDILSGIGVHVIPDTVAIGGAHAKLDGDQVTDEGTEKRLRSLAAALAQTTSRLKA